MYKPQSDITNSERVLPQMRQGSFRIHPIPNTVLQLLKDKHDVNCQKDI